MPELFISYRRESEAHISRVRDLATRLENAGIAVIFDEFACEREFHDGSPPRGWALWSIQMASRILSVLVMGSAGWFRVINNPQPTATGLGAAAEAETLIHRLNQAADHHDDCRIRGTRPPHQCRAAVPATGGNGSVGVFRLPHCV